MTRRFSFRVLRTCSSGAIFQFRNVILLTMVIITLWIFRLLLLTVNKTNYVNVESDSVTQHAFHANRFLAETSTKNIHLFGSVQLSPPINSQYHARTLLPTSTPAAIPPFISPDKKYPVGTTLPMIHRPVFTPTLIRPDRKYAVGGYLSQTSPMEGTGQGNLMFMYASLLGIASHADMTPVYPTDGHLRKIFVISTSSLMPDQSMRVNEEIACAFDPALFSIKASRNGNITLVGYLQSWKYFGEIANRIRQEFTFTDDLRRSAEVYLSGVLRNRSSSASAAQILDSPFFIGVHIRRRDMLSPFNANQGYTVATKEYIIRAVQYFQSQYPSNHLIYVVCGDDLDWARENFPSSKNSSQVVFSENRSAAEDMAILAACNHSIITVGTYGWWSAYLTGGRTVYYKDFPAPGTYISRILKKEDYFPPDWIGL